MPGERVPNQLTVGWGRSHAAWMTEVPSGQPDDLQPADAYKDHNPSDFAADGYDDRQDSGDASLGESLDHELGGPDNAGPPEAVGRG